MINFYNAILFYSIWWGCVLGVKYSYSFLGPVLALFLGCIHFKFISSEFNLKGELNIIAYGGLLGLTVEFLYLHCGLLNYNGYIFENSFFPPMWIICMWLAFSGTLNHSMSWMKGRWVLMIVSGALFGPLSYMAGINFGIISFNYNLYASYLAISLVWAISIPGLYIINNLVNEK